MVFMREKKSICGKFVHNQSDCMKNDLKKFFLGGNFKASDADNPSLGLAKQDNAEIFPRQNFFKSFFTITLVYNH